MRTNKNTLTYRPHILRSKGSVGFGRRFASWSVTVGGPSGLTYHVGPTEQLMAHGRDRRLDPVLLVGGYYQPRRRFEYFTR